MRGFSSESHVPQTHGCQLLGIPNLPQADCVDELVEQHRDVTYHHGKPEWPDFCQQLSSRRLRLIHFAGESYTAGLPQAPASKV